MTNINLAQLWPELAQPQWPQVAIHQLVLDSRQVAAQDVFFALQGAAQSQRLPEFVASALSKGAQAVFTEVPVSGFAGQPVFYIDELRQWIGVLAQRFLQAKHAYYLPKVAAVTGTNGKTTVSRLLAELLASSGVKSAVMGTTGNGILPQIEPSTHTTVDALHLQQQLYQFAAQGAQYVALEASSHGLHQGRLAGTPIEVAIFTNLTRDHLDYHGTVEHYAQAKALLFAFASLRYVILNRDDDAYTLMQQVALQNPAQPMIWTYSLNQAEADFVVQQVSYSLAGAALKIQTPQGLLKVQSPLLGHFNVANVLAVIAGAMAFGLTLAQIQAAIPHLQGAPGRMQVVQDQGRLFVVDYAHTPDALTQVLDSLKHHLSGRGKLWAVFGCGGDRDRGKRPLMTQAALQLADQVVLTADNPRSEAVEQILADMQAGVDVADHQSSIGIEPDRRMAIRWVVEQAQPDDIVVIAGKGHENFQEIDGVRHWFDDMVELKAALNLTDGSQHGYSAS